MAGNLVSSKAELKRQEEQKKKKSGGLESQLGLSPNAYKGINRGVQSPHAHLEEDNASYPCRQRCRRHGPHRLRQDGRLPRPHDQVPQPAPSS